MEDVSAIKATERMINFFEIQNILYFVNAYILNVILFERMSQWLVHENPRFSTGG